MMSSDSEVFQNGTIYEQAGKSLAEVLVVLAVIGITAGLAGPSFFALTARIEGRSATAEIASELRLARQLAMARRERLRVVFDRTQRTVTLQRADADGVLDVYRYGDKGIVVEEPSAGPDVLFHPTGRSATATTIVVRDKQGRATKLTVSVTGRVAIS
jgi:type IV fimbrial biogenesis protein FimT